ncbi:MULTISPECIES: sigma factor [unclassified Streptomyces]|uniref:RNA polymerase sigma factor n=1 Tax=unclassified Streptomyces TaxID=2593676 RepID=UPI000DBA26D7|nr:MULTISPECIES: sigma factor [unclassified Streptomyces]MYT69128.1 RNA polymerase subunit sigma-70 [Streptomyces sp. SID8367]RAJ82640.1 RNA polymerase sigma-70 factor (ECF subfamily) [Streptomyces sp. PsTaAH-137]
MADAVDDAARWERQVQIRLVRGEAAVLGEVYDRYARMLHSVAARLTGDEQATRDLVVGVFTHLWQQPRSFDPGRYRLGTWLVMAALDRHEAGPETLARLSADRVERADSALGAMNRGVRVAIHLVHTEKMDYRQAAAELGVAEDEILSRLRHGLTMLAGTDATTGEDGR